MIPPAAYHSHIGFARDFGHAEFPPCEDLEKSIRPGALVNLRFLDLSVLAKE